MAKAKSKTNAKDQPKKGPTPKKPSNPKGSKPKPTIKGVRSYDSIFSWCRTLCPSYNNSNNNSREGEEEEEEEGERVSENASLRTRL
jgi:hypothetical protein